MNYVLKSFILVAPVPIVVVVVVFNSISNRANKFDHSAVHLKRSDPNHVTVVTAHMMHSSTLLT